VTIARDVTLDMSKGEADLSTRGSTWRAKRGTIKEGNVDMELLYDPTSDDHVAFQAAFLNSTVTDMALADGAIATNGTQYFRADFEAFGFSRSEPLEDAVTLSVPLSIAYSNNAPTFVTVGA
jgi:hypothetical protein